MKTVESLNRVFVLYATNQSRVILCALHAPCEIFFDSLSHSIINEEILYTHASIHQIDREKEKNRLLKKPKKKKLKCCHQSALWYLCALFGSVLFHSFIIIYFFCCFILHSSYCCWCFLFFSSIYALIYNLDPLIVIGFCGLVCNRLCVNIWESLSPFHFDTIASSNWLPLYFPILMLWRAITEPETWNIGNT